MHTALLHICFPPHQTTTLAAWICPNWCCNLHRIDRAFVYLGAFGPHEHDGKRLPWKAWTTQHHEDLAQLVWAGNNKHIAFRDEGGPAWEADTDMEGGCTAFGSVVPCGLWKPSFAPFPLGDIPRTPHIFFAPFLFRMTAKSHSWGSTVLV